MKYLILFVTLYIFIYSLSCSNYEQHDNNNKVGAIVIRALAIIQLLFTNVAIFLLP